MKSADKILSLEQLLPLVEQWKSADKRIVFTNGCFDIVHLGHVDYLEKARDLGDKLVLGLNTDQSVRKLKGASRPIIPEYPRARLLAGFEFVDAIVLFDDDTPLRLIQQIKPDILTKGSDYQVQNIVGADFVMARGGKVATLDLIEGYSTSKIIEKIKNF